MWGYGNHVYCCPNCAYIIKNDMALLDHIIVGHYWGSFSCRKCLAFVAATAEWMRRHITGCGQSQMEHRKVRLTCTAKRIGDPNLAISPGRQRREQRKGLAWRHGRSHAVHQQGPLQWSPPRSRLRSTKSPCPGCLPMSTKGIWYAIISACVGHHFITHVDDN